MTHHNDPEDEAEDYLAAFTNLPEVLQTAALNVVHAAQELPVDQVLGVKARLEQAAHRDGLLQGEAAHFVVACCHLLDAHYEATNAVIA